MNLLHLALDHLASGGVIEGLWEIPEVRAAMNHARSDRGEMEELIRERSSITDRLAVVRLDGQARRPSGYLVTAVLGAECDACCIIHGYIDGSIDDPDRPALGASFYANSFHAHQHDGFDLSTLATSLDVTGGGHANACGCRIQPVDGRGFIEDRTLEPSDVERNLATGSISGRNDPTVEREVARILEAHRTMEGGGFPVKEAIPCSGISHVDPFLLIDEMGPVTWAPGAAIRAPEASPPWVRDRYLSAGWAHAT